VELVRQVLSRRVDRLAGHELRGTFVSLSSSPDVPLHPNTNVLSGKAPAIVNLTIPHDPSLHTASLTVTVDFALPGGDLVMTATGSMTLPHCPRRVAPSVTVTFGSTAPGFGCQWLPTVVLDYPATADLTTTVTITGLASTSSDRWIDSVSLSPGQTRPVSVPPPNGDEVVLQQDDQIPLGQYSHPLDHLCGLDPNPPPLPPRLVITPTPTHRAGTPPGPAGSAGAAAPTHPGLTAPPTASAPPDSAGPGLTLAVARAATPRSSPDRRRPATATTRSSPPPRRPSRSAPAWRSPWPSAGGTVKARSPLSTVD
jgi:hypothetical protein